MGKFVRHAQAMARRTPSRKVVVPTLRCQGRALSSASPAGSGGAPAEPLDAKAAPASSRFSATGLLLGTAVLAGGAGYYMYSQRVAVRKREEEEQARRYAEEAAERKRVAAELAAREAARKAAESARRAAEAKAAREEKESALAAAAAASADRCRELASVATALLPEVLVPRPSYEAVAELTTLLKAAEMESNGIANAEPFVRVRSRLAALQKAAAARASHDTALVALEESTAAQDTDTTRAALEELRLARETLTGLGEELPAHDRVTLGHEQLRQFEVRDRNNAAIAELQAAVVARDSARCKSALSQARELCLPPSPTSEVAEFLAEGPSRVCEELVSGGARNVIEHRLGERSTFLRVEDFQIAAKASTEGRSSEELLEQVLELVSALVRNSELHARELEQELGKLEPKFRQECIDRQGEAVARFLSDSANSLQGSKATLTEEWARRSQDEARAVARAILTDAQSECERIRQEVGHVAEVRLKQESDHFSGQFAYLMEPVSAMDATIDAGKGSQQRTEASSTLSGALMPFTSALLEGKASGCALTALKGAGDEFVTSVLTRLPSPTAERSSTALPTEPELRRRFKAQLNSFVAAALAPPADDLLTALYALTMGRLRACFYKLREEELPQDIVGTPKAAVQRALNTLARAAQLVERGQLLAALEVLEVGLPAGACRACADGWMNEARHTLILQQAARASQARARCLSMSLT